MKKNDNSFNSLDSRSASPLSEDQLRRIELLKLENELQRRQKERDAWHRASTPRSVFSDPVQKIVKTPPSHMKAPREELSFFSKLRLGKFLE